MRGPERGLGPLPSIARGPGQAPPVFCSVRALCLSLWAGDTGFRALSTFRGGPCPSEYTANQDTPGDGTGRREIQSLPREVLLDARRLPGSEGRSRVRAGAVAGVTSYRGSQASPAGAGSAPAHSDSAAPPARATVGRHACAPQCGPGWPGSPAEAHQSTGGGTLGRSSPPRASPGGAATPLRGQTLASALCSVRDARKTDAQRGLQDRKHQDTKSRDRKSPGAGATDDGRGFLWGDECSGMLPGCQSHRSLEPTA